MENFDYDLYYKSKSSVEIEFLKFVCKIKSDYLNELIDSKNFTIAEIGTGAGHVLNNLKNTGLKFGLDISYEALKQQMDNYFTKTGDFNLLDKFKFDNLYEKPINKEDIKNGLKNRNIINDKERSLFLIKIDAEKGLPFEENVLDYVLLCDILEHVIDPIKLLIYSKKIGRKLVVKIPIENALLPKLALKLNNIKYGVEHPSGHLFCWNYKQIMQIINKANLKVSKYKLRCFDYYTSKKKNPIKFLVVNFFSFLDLIFKTNKISLFFIGGNFYGILE